MHIKYPDGIRSSCPTTDNLENFAFRICVTLDVHNGRYFVRIGLIFWMLTIFMTIITRTEF